MASEREELERTLRVMFALQPEVRVTFVGKTGNGKSATGTTLLKALGSTEEFVAMRRPESVTTEPLAKTVSCFGGKFTIVDQPGLLDTRGKEVDLAQQKKTAQFNEKLGGIDVLVLVMNCTTKFTLDEQIILDCIPQLYPDALNHIFFVLTHGDILDTVAEEDKIVGAMQESINTCLSGEDGRDKKSKVKGILVSNRDDRRTPRGLTRTGSAIAIFKEIADLIVKNKKERFIPRPVEQKVIEEVVKGAVKKRVLDAKDIGEIFTAVTTVIRILSGSGCTIL